MNRKVLLVLAFGIMLSFSVYAQSDPNAQPESKGDFFFSAGVYNGIFSGGPVVPFSNFEIKRLTAATIGGYYELPFGPGNAFFGLEAGYSSGSKFGGKGDVDFIPFDLTAAYVFPLANILYIGPRLKLGALGMLGPEWNKAVLTAGVRLDIELRFAGFPLGLYVAGGIDAFPTAPEFATLPVIEAGLRFPRGKLKKSGASDPKNKEPAKTTTGGLKDDSSDNSAASGEASRASGQATPSQTAPAPDSVTPGAAATSGTQGPAVTSGTQGPAVTSGTQGSAATSSTQGAGTAPAASPATATQGTGTPGTARPGTAAPAAASPTQTAASATPQRPTVQGIPSEAQVQNRSIVLDDGRQGILNYIYFEPDTAVLIETYRPVLDMVGRQLTADPNLKLLIRAYAADFGTADGRYIVSVNRARFSRDFFTAQYGVTLNRFNIEAFGSDRSPIYVTSDWQSHRCVELILLRD